ncbi:MAG TPA: hypothetical protein DCP63_14660 [Bacteroidetes bacterium]|nr:hypothetical protein [Bacteroidota bacterium]
MNLLANPCREMIKSIPSIWDETVVLPPSEIGEVAVFARRSRHTWFLAILNGPSARTIRVPLSFLGPEPYNALLIRDNKDSTAAVNIEKTVLKRDDSPVIELHEGGGFIARFSRK